MTGRGSYCSLSQIGLGFVFVEILGLCSKDNDTHAGHAKLRPRLSGLRLVLMLRSSGQIVVRAFAAGGGNLAQQVANGASSDCINCPSAGAAAAGGAASGFLAPAAWGSTFSSGFALQVGERMIAGTPGAALRATTAILGSKAAANCGCPK